MYMPNEWQVKDEELDVLYPWYTKSFLDELRTWDLCQKYVWEYGLGAGSLWWACKCRKLYGVENNVDWFNVVSDKIGYASKIKCRIDPNYYVNSIYDSGLLFDIIVVDGDPVELRDKCIQAALDCLKPSGFLIIDNWLQPSVWMASEETKKLLEPYPYKIFKQENHLDWQTAVFIKL